MISYYFADRANFLNDENLMLSVNKILKIIALSENRLSSEYYAILRIDYGNDDFGYSGDV